MTDNDLAFTSEGGYRSYVTYLGSKEYVPVPITPNPMGPLSDSIKRVIKMIGRLSQDENQLAQNTCLS